MIQAGQILNDTYEIFERLGSGSGGIIFKAYHRRMQKYVAIKLIKDDIKEKLNNRSEVDVLKNLKNDYLPQVLDFIEDGGEVYTVMEFIEGQNFKQIISKGREFTEEQVRRYALQLCLAARYLHSHQPPIIHSDIKPSNIMLTPQDNICLIDFNISMIAQNGIAVSQGGSQGFAAPEQFKQFLDGPVTLDEFHEETRFLGADEETEIIMDYVPDRYSYSKTKNIRRAYVDVRTDIYGIGASIYYMLTGRVPLEGKTDFRGVTVSKQMQEIINKAMNPNPDRRFANVNELIKALEKSKKVGLTPSKIIAAASVVLAVSVGVIAYSVVTDKNNSEETDSITEIADTRVVSESNSTENIAEATDTVNSDNIAETSITSGDEQADIQPKVFDEELFKSKLLECINNDRSAVNVYSIKENNELTEIAQHFLNDIANGTYVKGTQSYWEDKFAYRSMYYEMSFDLNSYDSEEEAANALLKYEKENFSNKWIDERFQYYMADISLNDDGTYCLVFCITGDETITINGESYSRDLTELDLSGKGLSPADITSIPYMYNLETLKLDDNNIPGTDVFGKLPKLKVLWLDGNGVTTLSFLKNCKNLETITINHNNISDLSPLAEITTLRKIYAIDNNISDLSTINTLVDLETIDFRENDISQKDINEWADSMPNIQEIIY